MIIDKQYLRLQSTLKIVKSQKQTISKVAHYEKEKMKCPHCHNENIIKNGFSETGVQKYICKDCLKNLMI